MKENAYACPVLQRPRSPHHLPATIPQQTGALRGFGHPWGCCILPRCVAAHTCVGEGRCGAFASTVNFPQVRFVPLELECERLTTGTSFLRFSVSHGFEQTPVIPRPGNAHPLSSPPALRNVPCLHPWFKSRCSVKHPRHPSHA